MFASYFTAKPNTETFAQAFNSVESNFTKYLPSTTVLLHSPVIRLLRARDQLTAGWMNDKTLQAECLPTERLIMNSNYIKAISKRHAFINFYCWKLNCVFFALG